MTPDTRPATLDPGTTRPVLDDRGPLRPLGPVLDEPTVAGSNRRERLPGANWRFLLPDPAPRRVVVLGRPSAAALRTLRERAASVTVHDAADRLGPVEGELDLLVVLGARRLARMLGDPVASEAVRRALRPGAPILVEGHRLGRVLDGEAARERLERNLGRRVHARYALTPHRGEAETAVPIDQPAAADWLARRGLLRASLDRQDLARLRSAIGRRRGAARPGRGAARPGRVAEPGAGPSAGSRLRALVGRGLGTLAALERAVDRTVPALRREVALLRSGTPPPHTDPPAWLGAIAADGGVDLARYGWAVAAGAEYPSQKVLVPLIPPGARTPAQLVKVTREARFSDRLERAADALVLLERLGVAAGGTTPRLTFRGRAGDLAVAAETVVPGRPFREAVTPGLDGDRAARSVIGLLADLAERTRLDHPGGPSGAVATIDALLGRYGAVYRLDAREADAIAARVREPMERAGGFPVVLQHGDPGPQNLVLGDDGRIGLLDWENADPAGLPLADPVYFLWTYGVMEGGSRGIRDPFAAGIGHLLGRTAIAELAAEAVERHRARLDLEPTLVGPLVLASWVYQALKEATRLAPSDLERGVYRRIVRTCLERPDAPGLRAYGLGREGG